MAPANRLQALLDVSHKLSSSLDLSEVLRSFTDQATELTGATAAEISFWDRDRDELVMLVEHLGGTNEITEEGGQTYRLSDFPATRQVLETQGPIQIRVSNENDDPAERALLEERGRNALLMLPLIARGETIGMMEIVDEVDREFDAADVDFCQALCNVVAPRCRTRCSTRRCRSSPRATSSRVSTTGASSRSSSTQRSPEASATASSSASWSSTSTVSSASTTSAAIRPATRRCARSRIRSSSRHARETSPAASVETSSR